MATVNSMRFSTSCNWANEAPIEYGEEYKLLARKMDVLAAEFSRTHDENIKAEILAIASRLAEIREGMNYLH
jgi:hypothetical protein